MKRAVPRAPEDALSSLFAAAVSDRGDVLGQWPALILVTSVSMAVASSAAVKVQCPAA
jgi:hypothetical protein